MAVKFYVTIPAGDESHPDLPVCPVLLPASSWSRDRFNMRAPRLRDDITDRAADSGGFVAMKRWGGEYQYSHEEYVEWLRTFRPSWAATFDFCCEPAIAKDKAAIRSRQDRTTQNARELFDRYRAESWAWVPTIQGWDIDDYADHARAIRPLIEEMAAHYGQDSGWRVGIGTLCQRANASMVRHVVATVACALPKGTPLHLWGVTQRVIGGSIALPGNVVSVDSSAWNGFFGKGHEKWKVSGMTKREYGYKVALPAYLEKFEAAMAGEKSGTMWEMW